VPAALEHLDYLTARRNPTAIIWARHVVPLHCSSIIGPDRSARWRFGSRSIHGLGDVERLRRAFTERAEPAFSGSGIRLLRADTNGADAILAIEHEETMVPTGLYEGRMEGPGVLARTQVSLVRCGDSEPV
jgi:hypothetical protein